MLGYYAQGIIYGGTVLLGGGLLSLSAFLDSCVKIQTKFDSQILQKAVYLKKFFRKSRSSTV